MDNKEVERILDDGVFLLIKTRSRLRETSLKGKLR